MKNRSTAVVLFCLLPCLALLIGNAGFFWFGDVLLMRRVLWVPVVFPCILALSMCAVAVFVAHFQHAVSLLYAWMAITVSLLLLIVLFALVHFQTGVLCTAAVCPDAESVPLTQLTLPVPSQDGEAADAVSSSASGPVEVSLDRKLSTALYFSVVTFTTLGYGDFQPVPGLRLIAGLQALLGYLFLGLLVGSAMDALNRSLNNQLPGGEKASPPDAREILTELDGLVKKAGGLAQTLQTQANGIKAELAQHQGKDAQDASLAAQEDPVKRQANGSAEDHVKQQGRDAEDANQ